MAQRATAAPAVPGARRGVSQHAQRLGIVEDQFAAEAAANLEIAADGRGAPAARAQPVGHHDRP